jgi:hypothetical protein
MTGGGGDVLVLVRVALGEPGLGCLAALAVTELATPQQLRAQGTAVEEGTAGGYALVIEGARSGPHRARQITDAGGVVPPGQLLLRVPDWGEAAFGQGAPDGDDDPSGKTRLKDWDPSPDVPDLLVADAKAIQAALVLARGAATEPERAAAREKALKVMLICLQRVDRSKFASDGLVEGKIHYSEGNSKTLQGEGFAVFLRAHLEKHATNLGKKRTDLTKAEVTSALGALKVADIPKDDRTIHVQINTSHFATVSLLYSTVRHEWVHVEQLRAGYLAYIPDAVLRGVPGPDTGTLYDDREVEAYLWEMENLAGTGLKEASHVFTVWSQSAKHWGKAGLQAKKTLDARFKAAFAPTWKLAVEGHVTAIAAHHAKLKKDATVENPATVRTLYRDLEQLWKDRSRFGIEAGWKAHEAARATAIAQCEEILAKVISNDLDAADKAVAAGGLSAEDAYRTWFRLLNLPKDELPRSVVALHEARFKTTAPPLWEKAFTGFAVEIRKKIAEGKTAEANSLLDVRIETLWRHRVLTSAAEKGHAQLRQALQDEVRRARTK